MSRAINRRRAERVERPRCEATEPAWDDDRLLRCERPAGHDGLHQNTAGDQAWDDDDLACSLLWAKASGIA